MSDPLTVSVVIPAYNSEAFVREAADSALAQTHPPLEVIVVDDGSTDGTSSAVEPLADRISIIRKENAGVAAARNTGIRRTSGRLIAFLDADDVWVPTKLERQVEVHGSDPYVGLSHCGLTEVDQSLNSLQERRDGLEGDRVATRMLFGQGRLLHASGSTMMVSREAIEAVGDFDVTLPPSEDWELTYRIARSFRIGFVPEPLVLYRQHSGNAHRDIPRQDRSMMLALGKVFATGDPDIQALKRRSYGTVHGWLAACYWEAGDRRSFLRHAALAAWMEPSTMRRFAGFPVRRYARRRVGRMTPPGQTAEREIAP
jgi:glycosyltransferase involved in cell wall biosynthesis